MIECAIYFSVSWPIFSRSTLCLSARTRDKFTSGRFTCLALTYFFFVFLAVKDNVEWAEVWWEINQFFLSFYFINICTIEMILIIVYLNFEQEFKEKEINKWKACNICRFVSWYWNGFLWYWNRLWQSGKSLACLEEDDGKKFGWGSTFGTIHRNFEFRVLKWRKMNYSIFPYFLFV